jgi:hypothetical protein
MQGPPGVFNSAKRKTSRLGIIAKTSESRPKGQCKQASCFSTANLGRDPQIESVHQRSVGTDYVIQNRVCNAQAGPADYPIFQE